jgi:hypothetical protein
MDLISVHVPKCAGSTLRDALIGAYGEDQIYIDNGDRLLDPRSPFNGDRDAFLAEAQKNAPSILAGKSVVHGHFWVLKYRDIVAPRVTILRHPVNRLISHYLYWQHLGPHGHSLHDWFLAEKPSLIEFARMPQMRDFYRQVMFRDVDMRIFDLIGTVEKMDDAMAKLGKLTGREMEFQQNNNMNVCEHCATQKAEWKADKNLMAGLRDLLAADIEFYERHAMN